MIKPTQKTKFLFVLFDDYTVGQYPIPEGEYDIRFYRKILVKKEIYLDDK